MSVRNAHTDVHATYIQYMYVFVRRRGKIKARTFGDIWCQFVSFGPPRRTFISGASASGGRCVPFTATIRTTWSSVRQGREVPGNKPHPGCLHIDPAARSGTEGEPHPEVRL